jgi:mono/diheme cytochrome c family protein
MRTLLLAALLLGLPLALQGRAVAESVDYVRQVKPVLAAHCYACHGALQQKGGLRADTARSLREGGNHGPALVPGDSGSSRLVAHVTASNGARKMPPPGVGEALSDKEVALVRAWIDQGAAAPADERPEPDPREHWAFRTPTRPAVPPVKDGARVRNPVDAFIAAQREKRGLTPQPTADRRLLLRRVYLDLVGLPPTREEMAAFLADESPDAYEKVVDRLLESPQYGERWGRHWMDVWRYSDWWGLGAEVRNSQKHIWHWRDWIIESLNADKGYDQMLREMLAADELYPNDPDRLRATGFLARSYFKFNRNTWLEEVLEHTGKGFLGLTVNCARCHDHKFDPISQRDYYRLRAFFEPYQVRTDEIPGEVDFEKDGIPRVFDCNLDAPTYRFERGDERRPLKDTPLTPALPALLSLGELKIEPVALPPEARAPGLRPFVLEDQLQAAEHQAAAARAALQQARKHLAEREEKVPRTIVADRKPGDVKPLVQENFAAERPDTWEIVTGQWQYAAGKLAQRQDGDVRAALRLKAAPPADFQARARFTITGGRQWHSVGIAFDVGGDNEVLVYLSAFAGGPKLQIAYKQGGNYVYPAEAAEAWSIKLNEPEELTVRVRGSLMNVLVNGGQALAYRLPLPRRPGHLDLVAYDARAEFAGFELAPLPPDLRLVEKGGSPAKFDSVENARLSVALAEKALAAAEAQPAALRARTAADRARFGQPPEPKAKDIAREAARAERQAAVAKAEEDVARAELAVGMLEPAADKKLTAARDALAKAQKALEAPGEAYTLLRGSLKTLESNLETEESRNRPFPATSTGRRSALARWLTDPRHPLTARVAVNHIWARHFGKPLVPTVFDFGRKGTPPTHPALLDYLAVELMEHGWSMKHLHRLLVTSDTYRLSSSHAGAAAADTAGDPENRFYWRMNPVRMEAEAVRDSLLCLSGDLDPRLGGPPVPVADESSRRRSLYFVHSHNDENRFLSTFDEASVLECYRRSESIVPQQALALSNSKLALAAAARINARLHEQLGDVTDAQFARAAFETVLAATPTAAEQAECERALAEWAKLLKQRQAPDPVRRARGDLIQALLNHNDFITVR